jgi:DNA-binding MarR family transcriptional regulator
MQRLAEAECALAAAEEELLGALDSDERQTLYRLLHRATAGHALDCATAASAPLPQD